MKSRVLKRSFGSLKGNFRQTILIFSFCSLFGLTLSVATIYFSTNNLYMNEIDETYPCTLMITLDENTSDEQISDFEQIIKNYANVKEYKDLSDDTFEVVLLAHSLDEESLEYFSSFSDEFDNLIVTNSTNDTTVFLLQSIELAVGFQTIVILVFTFVVFALFVVLYISNARKFNKRANILLLLAETKSNIAKQFLVEQHLFFYVCINAFMAVGLLFRDFISSFWVSSVTNDIDTRSLVVSYENESEHLLSVVNSFLLSHVSLLFLSVFIVFFFISTASFLYYLKSFGYLKR